MNSNDNKFDDYQANIRLYLDHFKDLNLSEKDLNELLRALQVIKVNVMLRILQERVTNDKDLLDQIEAAENGLEARIASLSNELDEARKNTTYSEYEDKKYEDGVSEVFLERLREADKRVYEKEKEDYERTQGRSAHREAMRLEEEKSRLEKIKSNFDDKDKFIMSFVDTYLFNPAIAKSETLNSLAKETYQDLVRTCAISMIKPSGAQEFARTPIKDVDGRDVWNVSIFNQVEGTQNYTINPQALTAFLDLIRDIGLTKELAAYDETAISIIRNESNTKLYSGKKEQLTNAKRLLEDKALCAQVEDLLNRFTDIKNQEKALTDEFVKENSLPAVQKPGVWARFVNWILRKPQESEQQKEERANARAAKRVEVEGKLTELFREYADKVQRIPDFFTLCNIYFIGGAEKLNIDDAGSITTSFSALNEYLATTAGFKDHFNRIDDNRGEKSRKEFLAENLQLDEAIGVIDRKIGDNEKEAAELTAKHREEYSNLSPRAKQLVDAAPDGRVNMEEIVSRYIDQTAFVYGRITPYTASLIMEAFLHMNEVEREWNAEEIGITIDYGEIMKAKDKAVDKAMKHLEQLKGEYEPEV